MEPDSSPAPRRKRGAKARLVLAGIVLILLAGTALYFYRNRAPSFDLPEPTMPVPNAYQAFIRAGEQAQRLPHKSPYDLEAAGQAQRLTPASLAAFHRDAAPVLALVRRALGEPYHVPPDRSASPALMLNNYLFVRLEHVIAGEAIYYERAGQPDRAMDTLLDGLELAVTIPRGGTLLPGLVGAACETVCDDQIEPLLPRLSPAELARAAAHLERIEARRTAFADTLTEEADLMTARQQSFLQEIQGLKIYDTARELAGVEHRHTPTWGQFRQIAGFCLADKPAMVQANRDYLLALAAEARKPYTGPSRQRVPDNLLAPAADTFQTGRDRFLTCQAVAAILRTEIALLRFHAAHGRYPDQLTQLVPAFLPSVPADPFGGGAGVPLRYRRAADGKSFLLYSLGAGLQDHGGHFTPHADADDPGNIVAGHLWRRPTLGVGSAED